MACITKLLPWFIVLAKILVQIFRLRQTTSDISLSLATFNFFFKIGMNFAQCLLEINSLWPVAILFAVFKMAEICERSERATENKKASRRKF